MDGKVKWFNREKGFGFLSIEDGQDVFIHISVVERSGLEKLQEGQVVKFELVTNKGKTAAANLIAVENTGEDVDNDIVRDETTDENIEKDVDNDNEFIGFGIFDNQLRCLSLNKDGTYKFLDPTSTLHNLLYVATADALAIQIAIEELEFLINNPNTDEITLQQFFERNPTLICNDEYKQAHPHVILERDEGPLIPDFLLEPVDQSGLCDILDLKLPTTKLFVLKKSRMRYSAAVFEACSQLREYSNFFDDSINREKTQEKYGLLAYKPKMIVIIGRKGSIDHITKRKIESDMSPNIQLKTYDDLISRAKTKFKLK